jgi:hypothetical protein
LCSGALDRSLAVQARKLLLGVLAGADGGAQLFQVGATFVELAAQVRKLTLMFEM